MGFASWQRYCTASRIGRQPDFAALNRGRHLCLAGRPSRGALAHILVANIPLPVSLTVYICHETDSYPYFMTYFYAPVSTIVSGVL